MILVTGATGYVGGRLVRAFLQARAPIRCLARAASRLVRPGWENVEVVEGDAHDEQVLASALSGVSTAYYLIHSMGGAGDFARRDVDLAAAFARVASKQGVQRIIYLGGLGDNTGNLSKHLESRQATGDALRSGTVPVIEFRAGMVLGSGSLSFEILRDLAERVPLMICPRWVRTRTQPIAVRDVLSYLIAAHTHDSGAIYEIGGSDVVSYQELILLYARLRGLKRRMINVPYLTPRLSSYWVDLVTSVPASVSRPLIDGLRNEMVCRESQALVDFDIKPMSVEEAMKLAIARTVNDQTETRWSDSFSVLGQSLPPAFSMKQIEGMVLERRTREVNLPATRVFQAVQQIGGDHGWPYADSLWEIRGFLDRLVGGVGMRRGRRSQTDLRVGDPVDFWRVEAIEPNCLLRLHAEMKVPGKAWLQFTVQSHDENSCSLEQMAFFEPKGLGGLLYWYSLYPLHKLIFTGMINRIVLRAA